MGRINLRFKATRGKRVEVFSAIVDSGADVTNLNMDTACELGLDPTTAPEMKMRTAGGTELIGYELTDVHLKQGRRQATLARVFVPIRLRNGVHVEKVRHDDEQLIGHDFLQATDSVLDFSTHTLRGRGKPVTAHPKQIYRRATPEERLLLKGVVCKVRRKR